ncbi:hypothetical protein N5923_11910 [Erwiniaceae bacterium BAC15a-03b]|uniref:Uncharacterized protein n=1 Tax=Winslowiella arboricola TaxID=2978220 RepID=A0A9J6PP80_9GAMM|nr:hypothetical protein [Winslowiella arboricola]MCU5771446.1 hypothetical protein [Winslowiella arboricola]MCU5778195.1 hypothetical protein [Winslowiella arboricola]
MNNNQITRNPDIWSIASSTYIPRSAADIAQRHLPSQVSQSSLNMTRWFTPPPSPRSQDFSVPTPGAVTAAGYAEPVLQNSEHRSYAAFPLAADARPEPPVLSTIEQELRQHPSGLAPQTWNQTLHFYRHIGAIAPLENKHLTAAGIALKVWHDSSGWNPYKQLAGETPLEWARRLSNMNHLLTDRDVSRLTGCNEEMVKTQTMAREPLSDAARRVMNFIHSKASGELSYQQGEEWPDWVSRLAENAYYLSEKEVRTLTGFTPAIEQGYPANKLLQDDLLFNPRPKRISTTSLPAPRPVANLRGAIQVLQQKLDLVRPANDMRVEQFLNGNGWSQLPNDAKTGTDYNNSLLIALLQLATHDYSQSFRLSAKVNKYRQRLVQRGWLGHAQGFLADGIIAFKPSGAAAAFVDMLNQDLIARQRQPLRVINYRFLPGISSQDTLGSFDDNAREVHILNIGHHFSALLPLPRLPPPCDNFPAVAGPSRAANPPPVRPLKLTAKPSRPPTKPVVITLRDLSGDGEKMENLINSKKIKLNSSSMPIIRIRELLLMARKYALLLTETDIIALVSVTEDEIRDFPKNFSTALSSHGLEIIQILDSTAPGHYAWKESETSYQWAGRLIQQQPELTTEDLILITGGNGFWLRRLWKAHKAGLSDSGKKLLERLNSEAWSPHKPYGNDPLSNG